MERKSKKILAIDDVPDVLNSIRSVLHGGNYMVYGVTSHTAALKYLASNTADLILLDIDMPDMDGFALLTIIRKMEQYKDTPILFLTGSVSVENVMKSHSFGANDFIRKPIDALILTERVGKHLGPRRV